MSLFEKWLRRLSTFVLEGGSLPRRRLLGLFYVFPAGTGPVWDGQALELDRYVLVLRRPGGWVYLWWMPRLRIRRNLGQSGRRYGLRKIPASIW